VESDATHTRDTQTPLHLLSTRKVCTVRRTFVPGSSNTMRLLKWISGWRRAGASRLDLLARVALRVWIAGPWGGGEVATDIDIVMVKPKNGSVVERLIRHGCHQFVTHAVGRTRNDFGRYDIDKIT
jgi:hypothetical protein